MEANGAQELEDCSHEADVEHWFREFKMPEMARAIVETARARLTFHMLIDGSHSGVKETASAWFSSLIPLWRLNLTDRVLTLNQVR